MREKEAMETSDMSGDMKSNTQTALKANVFKFRSQGIMGTATVEIKRVQPTEQRLTTPESAASAVEELTQQAVKVCDRDESEVRSTKLQPNTPIPEARAAEELAQQEVKARDLAGSEVRRTGQRPTSPVKESRAAEDLAQQTAVSPLQESPLRWTPSLQGSLRGLWKRGNTPHKPAPIAQIEVLEDRAPKAGVRTRKADLPTGSAEGDRSVARDSMGGPQTQMTAKSASGRMPKAITHVPSPGLEPEQAPQAVVAPATEPEPVASLAQVVTAPAQRSNAIDPYPRPASTAAWGVGAMVSLGVWY